MSFHKDPQAPRYPGVFALTGGAATGKSTIAEMIRSKGIRVLDADALTRTLYEPGSPVLSAIRNIFGSTDKDVIREAVFSQPEKRKKLEALLHPVIQSLSQKFFELERSRGYTGPIFYEAALIFEAKRAQDFEGILLVDCPREVQLARLINNRKISKNIAEAILSTQSLDANELDSMRKQSRWVVQTDRPLAEIQMQVDEILSQL